MQDSCLRRKSLRVPQKMGCVSPSSVITFWNQKVCSLSRYWEYKSVALYTAGLWTMLYDMTCLCFGTDRLIRVLLQLILLHNTVYPRNPAKLNSRRILLPRVFRPQPLLGLRGFVKQDDAYSCMDYFTPVSNSDVEWWETSWMINWNGYGRNRSWPNWYISQHATWGTEENNENLHLNCWKPRKTTSIVSHEVAEFRTQAPRNRRPCRYKIAPSSDPTTVRHEPRNDR